MVQRPYGEQPMHLYRWEALRGYEDRQSHRPNGAGCPALMHDVGKSRLDGGMSTADAGQCDANEYCGVTSRKHKTPTGWARERAYLFGVRPSGGRLTFADQPTGVFVQ